MGTICCYCCRSDDKRKADRDYSLLEDGGRKEAKEGRKRGLSLFELMRILKPYFWPSAGTDGACVNRFRALSTWIMVGLSKVASLMAPLYLLVATNMLIQYNLKETFMNVIFYCCLRFASTVFKGTVSRHYVESNFNEIFRVTIYNLLESKATSKYSTC